jgi:dienelactone hydrolase
VPLTRRDLLALAFAPPTEIRYRDYSRVLPGYLSRLAADAYTRRLAALASTPLKARQKWARETFWNLTGGPPPERTALNVRTTGSFERAAYRVEKLIYESRPGFHVPANLYIPKGTGPFPGVLFQMGHSPNGKASGLYQYCCQGMVQLGFVVLAFDPMGQGERTYYPRADSSNLTRLDSADTEHTLPGKQLILAGDTSTRMQTWDAVRSLDVLAAHPMVDPKRLASTGNSGGGTLTMLLMAVDDRLACASVACGNTENVACANYNPPGSTDDAEQNFLFGGPVGFDRWDTVYPHVPKPLQFLLSGKDSQGTYSPRYLENGREEYARLAKHYVAAGKAANLEWIESPLPHGLSYDIRMHIYRWFRLHLQGISAPLAEEPKVAAELDRTLYATESGNAVRDLGSLTPRQIAVARLNEKPVIPPKLPAPTILARRTKLGETQSRNVRIEAWEIESEPQVFLPAWAFFPKGQTPKATLVLLEPAGRNGQWNEESLAQQLAAQGIAVISPDLRGIGDLRPEFPRSSPQHGNSHQREEAYAWASMILGRPLLDQRIADLRAVIRAAGAGHLAARGVMTIPALHALLAEPGVKKGYLAGGLASYRSLLDQEEPSQPLANLEFGGLQGADIPAMLERAGSRAGTGDTWNLATIAALVAG